jgi:hypothetical protein
MDVRAFSDLADRGLTSAWSRLAAGLARHTIDEVLRPAAGRLRRGP